MSERVVVALDPELGVVPADLAGAWNSDELDGTFGPAEVESAGSGTFLPGVVELVVLPLAVNLASTLVYERVRQLVLRLRGASKAGTVEELEVIQHERAGERLLVVRIRRSVP
jgi:hypothetical protein